MVRKTCYACRRLETGHSRFTLTMDKVWSKSHIQEILFQIGISYRIYSRFYFKTVFCKYLIGIVRLDIIWFEKFIDLCLKSKSKMYKRFCTGKILAGLNIANGISGYSYHFSQCFLTPISVFTANFDIFPKKYLQFSLCFHLYFNAHYNNT